MTAATPDRERLSLAGKSVVVTGGAGFIGSHLVERIAREGPRSLSVIDNMYLGRPENLARARELFPELQLHTQDASDYDAVGAIVAADRVDVFFNLAIVPLPASLINPRWTVDHNVALATVPCELQRQGFFETLIHFSSSEAYGSATYVPMDEEHPSVPSTPYAASKLAGDYVVLSYRETYQTDVAILRPFNNFGPLRMPGRTRESFRSWWVAPFGASRSSSTATASRRATSSSSATLPMPPSGCTSGRPRGGASSTLPAVSRSR